MISVGGSKTLLYCDADLPRTHARWQVEFFLRKSGSGKSEHKVWIDASARAVFVEHDLSYTGRWFTRLGKQLIGWSPPSIAPDLLRHVMSECDRFDTSTLFKIANDIKLTKLIEHAAFQRCWNSLRYAVTLPCHAYFIFPSVCRNDKVAHAPTFSNVKRVLFLFCLCGHYMPADEWFTILRVLVPLQLSPDAATQQYKRLRQEFQTG